MADQKLSQLPNITTLANTDELYVSDGASKAVAFSVLRDQVRLDAGNGLKLGLGVGRLNSFYVGIRNNGGTLEHIIEQFMLAGQPFVSAVNGATNSWTATPTGTDSSTAFAAGAKVSSADFRLILNTADFTGNANLDTAGISTVRYNDTGTGITAFLGGPSSRNINGVTRARPEFVIMNATTGAAVNLNTTNIANGKMLQIAFFGFLPDYA